MNEYLAFCGLYCGACLCNIAHETDTLELMAAKLNKPPEQLTCSYCRTALHEDCCFVMCCCAKGIESCADCDEMPCEELTKFANDGIFYHATTIPNLRRIREIGVADWLKEQKNRYTCPDCNSRLGWGHKTCATCGKEVFEA
ncbi:MAG: DUF3795 domain-containing protein [Candidatus Cloacimonetes bacterium]|nr:DUF3795 domain-containing protein [Candidatus Cloacimonadota bacterium]